MANNSRYYYSLPTEAPARSRSGSRRPPLTPSTVSSPCVTTLVSLPRRDSAGSAGSPTKAHALLAKVVSSPPTPRSETSSSLSTSPAESRTSAYSNSSNQYERPAVWRSESDRYVRQYRQQDGYISFPDFEQFCQSQNGYDQRREQSAVKT
ncbi:hypothetical protein DE146DRAFT_188899 [Phaeosphaeria sp. MPI-PUGE-AT-0046c]|nr:hypothetical protein DE146DRAFT_188899 [Phaeosphaeria sp. MPI-PUGE-AT-0046c]